jgi:HSP20 family molecular chaperone IbpA
MRLGRATRTVVRMTSPSPTLDELRRDLEHLVADLFEGDRRGAIPALDINRRDGQLVVYARLPGRDDGDSPMGVEVRLPCAAA